MILDEAEIEDGLRLYAIGDIHGCLAELNTLLSLIEDDLKVFPVNRHKLIFLGDYVDRGPENKQVIETLIRLGESKRETVFLRGNHDDKFSGFLKHPDLIGSEYLKWGGGQTISSYGVEPSAEKSFSELSQEFRVAVPKSHIRFLKELKYSHVEGDYFFCHAGVRPGTSLDDQLDYDLMWIRTDFLFHEQAFEKVIVHGHTPHDEPQALSNRINVDTCCYDTGRLTAVVLEADRHRFISS